LWILKITEMNVVISLIFEIPKISKAKLRLSTSVNAYSPTLASNL